MAKGSLPTPPSSQTVVNVEGVNAASKALMIPFFMVHYGMFTFVHGIFLFTMFFTKSTFYINHDFMPILIFFIATIISHGVSFLTNFLRTKEYERKSTTQYMFSPYPRVMVMHFVIMFGALFFGNVIVLFVLLKTILDIFLHLGSHAKIAQVIPPEPLQTPSHIL